MSLPSCAPSARRLAPPPATSSPGPLSIPACPSAAHRYTDGHVSFTHLEGQRTMSWREGEARAAATLCECRRELAQRRSTILREDTAGAADTPEWRRYHTEQA